MLSFVFLADGPCDPSSWRINDDKNQWWSRRDALVRIISTSLWLSPGRSNEVVDEAAILFGVKEKNGNNCNYSLVMHSAKKLTSKVCVPTERELIKCWKEAFTKTSKASVGLNLQIGGDYPQDGILCSCEPWKEMILTNKAGNKSNSFISSTVDVASLDKRELLQLLQHNSCIEFLRKHNLNGSEALILKKKNRDTIKAAYDEWERQLKAEQKTSATSTVYSRLVDTCKVMLGGIIHRAHAVIHNNIDSNMVSANASEVKSPTGYLLFLHEDYAQELPVFGDLSVKCNTSGVPIICAMGAVRDALDEEVRALIEAAQALNIQCVGANLGRTAEFTSKIVTSLVAHAIAGRLHSAVSALPSIAAAPGTTSTTTVEHKGASTAINKLVPQRPGGWSWDGEFNKLSGQKRKEASAAAPSSGEASVCTSGVVTQHHLVVVAWLPLLPQDVTDAMEHREEMHGLVQLVVNTLWRSRLASEAAREENAGKNGTALEDDVEAARVVPTLNLIFRDGSIAELSQRRLAITMANQHMAAPSEYQVLHMLVTLLSDPSVLTGPRSVATSGVNVETLSVSDALRDVLPSSTISKAQRKALRVVELTDTVPVTVDTQQLAILGSKQKQQQQRQLDQSIAQIAYGRICSCCSRNDQHSTSTSNRADIVVLLNPPQNNTSTHTAIMQELFRFIYNEKTVPTDEKKLYKKVGRMYCRSSLHSRNNNVLRVSPYLAITTLQHFAYHDRLYPAINQEQIEM